MSGRFTYCPYCRGTLSDGTLSQRCPDCGRTTYHNVATAAGMFLINDRDEVLLPKRAFEPKKGTYGITGGFANPGESALQTALREVEEETGLTDIEVLDLIGTYPDRYGDDETYTLNIIYVGRLRSGKPKAGDDAAALDWLSIPDMPEAVFTDGFRNAHEALRGLQAWYKQRKPETP